VTHLVWFCCPGKPTGEVVRAYEKALEPLGSFALVWITPAGFSKVFRAEALKHKRQGRILPGLLTAYPPPSGPSTVSIIAFSAGYGLPAELLASAEDRQALDGLVLLDGLHAGYDPDGTAGDAQLAPFIEFARRAIDSQAIFAFGHTDVSTYRQYASTTESGDELLRLLDMPGEVSPNEQEGYMQRARQGGFVVRAYDLFPPEKDKSEHGAALTKWGPKLVAEELVPWLRALAITKPPTSSPEPAPVVVSAPPATQTIQHGSFGPLVGRWQTILNRDGKPVSWTNSDGDFVVWDPGWAWPLKIDDDFGDRTKAATECWQSRRGLKADGVVGPKTWAKAKSEEPLEPDTSRDVVTIEPFAPPLLKPLGTAGREQLFGKFRYEARADGTIRYLDDWPAKNIVRIVVPELERIPGVELSGKRVGAGPAGGVVHCHRLMAPALQALFAAWREARLLDHLLTWAGLWSPRLVRGSTSTLSSHAWGTAFDVNAPWNALGQLPARAGDRGSVVELVPLAREHGFFWGGDFSRPDGMHFELARA
jgi:hypothetical protein